MMPPLDPPPFDPPPIPAKPNTAVKPVELSFPPMDPPFPPLAGKPADTPIVPPPPLPAPAEAVKPQTEEPKPPVSPPSPPLDFRPQPPHMETGTPPANKPLDGFPVEVRPQPSDPPPVNVRDAVPVVVSRDFTPVKPVAAIPTQPIVVAVDGHIVRGQDTYASISQQYYGTDRYQHALAELNRQRDPRLATLKPGDVVEVPTVEALQVQFPQLATGEPAPARPLDQAGQERGISGPRTGQPVAENLKLYRVQPNDTIWLIAKRTLGAGDRWHEIFHLNKDRLRQLDRLEVGMTLQLPPDARVE